MQCMICNTTNEHTLYSFPYYTFLWPEDGPHWPKHVVSIKSGYKDSCVLTYLPLPNYINTTGMMHLKKPDIFTICVDCRVCVSFSL